MSGLPEPRKDHAVVIAKFAHDCIVRMNRLAKALETSLGYVLLCWQIDCVGFLRALHHRFLIHTALPSCLLLASSYRPDTGDLAIRVGVHSGQVTAGVLRGDKGRFQLFGDTMNTTARLESTGVRNKIQCSQETADLLQNAGYGKWLVQRSDEVDMKGKGSKTTYFIQISSGSRASRVTRETSLQTNSITGGGDHSVSTGSEHSDSKKDRLVEWNVEVLCGLLERIVARREARNKKFKSYSTSSTLGRSSSSTNRTNPLEEVQEIITLPAFNESALRKQVDPSQIRLNPNVVAQLTKLVTEFADLYRKNPFHSFEHVSHVTMSVVKMMTRIVDPKEIALKKKMGAYEHTQALEAELHDHTFGITSDPLTQFACVFSALIHDLDHQGVPNATLIKELSPLADKYKNKSVAEQHSVDLAWKLLTSSEYDQLRMCICCDEEEFQRFRSLVVNSVMATDIVSLACAYCPNVNVYVLTFVAFWIFYSCTIDG